MKYCYANRRHTLYPNSYDNWNASPEAYDAAFLRKVAELGFEGIEIGFPALDAVDDDESRLRAFGEKLRSSGVPAVSIRAGGSLVAARHYADNRNKLLRMIRYAGMLGVGIVNGALSAPARYPGKPGSSTGWPVSQDASRDAMIYDYERLAEEFQKACDLAREEGVTISVEVHQNSLVDNSWSAKLIHELVDRPNFGINPDLGNIFWTYDVAEERIEDAIKTLAPISVYWHCKNLMRVYHPENERSVFLRVPLPDGEIDYRFALSAMVEANYPGYMAIEGMQVGDQFYLDGKSLQYAKQVVAELERRPGIASI